ncbi:MAG: Membrane-bound lytic murein transglycosylase F [Fimbriimonadaceae bacterium]|nr:Membrane-bound lytic murein transglycosylase F [Fimbriimonadaceae bacterium]
MIRPLGPDGVRSRMAEIQARMEALRPQRQEDQFSPSPLSGNIGKGSFTPMDPFGSGLDVQPGPAPRDLRPIIEQAASEAGIEADLLEAMTAIESGFNARAVSPKGALGLTQLMPQTAKTLGITDPLDPIANLRGGARYMAQMLRRYGDVRTALAAYNAGPGNVDRYNGVPPFPETRNHIERVMGYLEALKGR